MSGLQLPARAAWWHLRARDLMIISVLLSYQLGKRIKSGSKTLSAEIRALSVAWPWERRLSAASLNLWEDESPALSHTTRSRMTVSILLPLFHFHVQYRTWISESLLAKGGRKVLRKDEGSLSFSHTAPPLPVPCPG